MPREVGSGRWAATARTIILIVVLFTVYAVVMKFRR